MTRPNDYRLDGNTFRLPISQDRDRHAFLWIPHPVTAEEWDRMLVLLGTFRDGLVAPEDGANG